MSPTSPARVRPLHLPTPGLAETRLHPTPRSGRKRRRRPSKLRHLGIGMVCVAGGGLILSTLMALAERFNTLLLVSQAVANLIKGLSLLATGLLQLVALLMVAASALLALLLLLGGITRMARAISLAGQQGLNPRSEGGGRSSQDEIAGAQAGIRRDRRGGV